MKSNFKESVLKVVKGIKKGTTMTYTQVAAAAGRPGAARAVGTIMSRNKDARVPCHRVIRADGTLGGYNRLRSPSKAALLEMELYV